MIITPRQTPLNFTASLPGDKSISHRAALTAALAEGESLIRNFSNGEDCATTLNCLTQLGIPVIVSEYGGIIIKGKGLYGFNAPEKPLYCGNSGTTARLLAGILAGQSFASVITGDESLSRRPMKRIIEPLIMMNAEIRSTGLDTLPFYISGRRLQAIAYNLPVASAQLKSCMIFAGLFADGTTVLHECGPTRDHTERLLRSHKGFFQKENKILITGRQPLTPFRMTVPGDLSSAAFLIAAATLIPESDIYLQGLSINPTRIKFIDIFREMGAEITIENIINSEPEPSGDIRVRYSCSKLKSVDIPDAAIPLLIDELPLLAVMATQTKEGLLIRKAAELRYKESDRIQAIAKNLKRMGTNVIEYDDGLRVFPCELRGAEIDTCGDHRIAMAFTVAALIAKGNSTIREDRSVQISFPDFFQYFH